MSRNWITRSVKRKRYKDEQIQDHSSFNCLLIDGDNLTVIKDAVMDDHPSTNREMEEHTCPANI